VFKLPRGTRDFTPEDMQKRRYVEKNMTSTFKSFGYKEIQTPIFETLELFTAKSGESIIDELYSFKDKSGRDLSLRPELTAPVMRFYVDKLQMESKPLKLFYFGSCFRYDRPQKGRYREFQQMGCELIGTSTEEAIAELISLAYYTVKNTGLKDISLRIGNLDFLKQQFDEKLSKYYKEGSDELFRLIDKEDINEIQNQFTEYGVPDDKQKEFLDFLNYKNMDDLNKLIKNNDLERFEKIISLLERNFSIPNLKIDMNIARGLDYYKGIVFEIDAPVLGAEKQLCGGGEYELVESFGGTDVPTSGFALGFDRIILALETEDFKFPADKIDIYIIPVDLDVLDKCIELAQKLRKEGFVTDLDLLRRGIGKSLKYANSKNVKNTIIVGPEELKNESVILKDMISGNQELINIKEITSKLKKS
jgi:histidyl-tRNA synthetase